MFKVFIFLVALWATAGTQIVEARGTGIKRTVREPLSHEMLVISQSVGTDYSVGLRARIGYVTSSNKTMSMSRGSVYNKNNLDWKPLDAMKWNETWSASEALAVSKQHVQYFQSNTLPAMQNFMQTKKLPQGWFSYQQWVRVTGDTGVQTRLVTWSVFVTDYGNKISYGDPVLLSGKPTILQAVYANKEVQEGLPPEWSYPDAGLLKYRLLDQQMMPISDWTTLSTGGVFDQPAEQLVSEDGTPSTEMSFGVKCIIEGGTGCPTGYKTIKSLMTDNSSLMAFLDYTYRLEPAYDDNENAKIDWSVTKRKVERSKCSDAVYTNEGNFGYTLSVTANRYFIASSGEYSLVDSRTTEQQSPVKAYSKSVPVGSANPTSLADYVITPEEGKSELLPIASVAPKFVAPFSYDKDEGTLIGLFVGIAPATADELGNHIPANCTYVRIGCSASSSAVGVYYGNSGSCSAAGGSARVVRWLTKGQASSGALGSGSIAYDGGSSIVVTGGNGLANAIGSANIPLNNMTSSVLYGVHGDFAGSYNAGTLGGVQCDNIFCALDPLCTNPQGIVAKYNYNYCKTVSTWGDPYEYCSTQSMCTYMDNSADPAKELPYGRMGTTLVW